MTSTSVFNKSEQQRQLFVLFESEFEKREIFEAITQVTLIEPKEYFVFQKENPDRTFLERAIKEHSQKCVYYDISEIFLEEETTLSSEKKVTKYIFVYPEESLLLRWVDEEGKVIRDPSGNIIEYLSFYLKNNIYINRIKTECPKENAN